MGISLTESHKTHFHLHIIEHKDSVLEDVMGKSVRVGLEADNLDGPLVIVVVVLEGILSCLAMARLLELLPLLLLLLLLLTSVTDPRMSIRSVGSEGSDRVRFNVPLLLLLFNEPVTPLLSRAELEEEED